MAIFAPSLSNVRRAAAVVLGATLSAGVFAVPVTYDFTTVDGHSGSFSYEDTMVSPSSNIGPTVAYNILSFTLDCTSFANPYIELDHSIIALADIADVFAPGQNVSLQLYGSLNLFKGNDLAQLDGRTLADFTLDPGLNRTGVNIGGNISKLATLQQVVNVPEPGTGTLMLMGLGGGVLVARRRQRSR